MRKLEVTKLDLEVYINLQGNFVKGIIVNFVCQSLTKPYEELINGPNTTYIVQVDKLKGEFRKDELFIKESNDNN